MNHKTVTMISCLGALVFTFETADAAVCHKYRVWKYPRPQSCGAHHPKFVPVVNPKSNDGPDDHSWYVEITRLPPLDGDPDREKGVEELKKQLSK